MISNSFQLIDPSILIFMGISLVLNGLIAYLWHIKFYKKFGLKTYQAIQRIHLNETPRLGGAIFILSLFSYAVYCNASESILFLKLILISLIPVIIIGLKEDLFHNIDPAIRLFSLFFAGCLFRAKFTGSLPNLADVPLISKLLILQGGTGLFYILSITAVANGMNLLDGVNGLCSAVSLSALSALLFLSLKTSDLVMQSTILSAILIFIPFIIMNYPYGKIFLGDLGAYSLGLISSILTIILFGRHPEISPWCAVLILIYPSTEVVFSLLRRIIEGSPIYQPDTAHLHLKIFHFFRLQSTYKKIANALVTPTLSMLWLFPLFSIIWFYQRPFFICIAIVLFIVFYGLLYLAVPNSKMK